MGASDINCLQLCPTIILLVCPTKSDASHLSKARLLSQALRYPEVADLPHQHLSTGLLAPIQDWAFLHRCFILDRPNRSESVGPIDILHRTPSLEHSQSISFNSLIKFILVLLVNPLFNSCSLNLFQIESTCSSSFSCRTESLVWGKGSVQLYMTKASNTGQDLPWSPGPMILLFLSDYMSHNMLT